MILVALVSRPRQYELNLGLFRDLQSILALDTQIPDSTLQSRVSQKQLDGRSVESRLGRLFWIGWETENR